MMMTILRPTSPPNSEGELLARAHNMVGTSLGHLFQSLGQVIPENSFARKGLAGHLIELALGADAGSKAEPDFKALQIELKTLPLLAGHRPAESTFVTSIPLLSIGLETFETSQCFKKLKRVLWVTIEGDRRIPYAQRRIGRAFLWSPNVNQFEILKQDWNEIANLIINGDIESIDGRIGQALHVRPKASNASALCQAIGAQGEKVLTLPRGFYLRSVFTQSIYQSAFSITS